MQDPQRSVPPQPSAIEPQFLPRAAHVVGVQAAAGFTVKSAVAVLPRSEAEIDVTVEASGFPSATDDILVVRA